MKKPKYDYGDIVGFDVTLNSGKSATLEGEIQIIDKYGTFEQHEEPSYDVMIEDWFGTGQQMFFKHLRESCIKYKKEKEQNNEEIVGKA